MRVAKTQNRRRLMMVGACLVVFGVVYFAIKQLNDLTGYAADDPLYRFFFTGEWPARHLRGIHNPLDLIQSLQNHTRINNGRFVAHGFVQLMMQWPKSVFNVVNSLVFLLVGVLVNWHADGRVGIPNPGRLVLTYTLMWWCLPDYGSAILWLSGGCNYLWTAAIYLVFLLPYRLNYKAHRPWLMTAGMILLGFLAGATNENTAALTLFAALMFTIMDWRGGQLFWKWAGGISGLEGFIILVLSGMRQIDNRGDNQFDWQLLVRMTAQYSGVLLVGVLAWGLYLYFAHRQAGQPGSWRHQRQWWAAGINWLAALLGMVALIVSPEIVSRVFFGPNVYLLVALMTLLVDYQTLRRRALPVRLLPGLVTIVLVFTAIPAYGQAVQSLRETYAVWLTGDTLAKRAAAAGKTQVAVPGMPTVTDTRNVYRAQTYAAPGDPDKQWFNVWMARYYGLQRVTVDNSVRVQALPERYATRTYAVTTHLARLHDQIQSLWRGQDVQAATMQTATLVYVDEHGQQVGLEPISGLTGSTFDIHRASVAGYTTLPGNPQAYTFTAAANQQVTIRVAKQAATAHAILIYQADGQTVGTEPLTGAAGSTVDIHRARLAGYSTLAGNPQTVRLTAEVTKRVIIRVTPTTQSLQLVYVAGTRRVATRQVSALTGKRVPFQPPFGYALATNQARGMTMPTVPKASYKVAVVRVAWWRALWQHSGWRLVLIWALIFVGFDQLLAAWQRRH